MFFKKKIVRAKHVNLGDQLYLLNLIIPEYGCVRVQAKYPKIIFVQIAFCNLRIDLHGLRAIHYQGIAINILYFKFTSKYITFFHLPPLQKSPRRIGGRP